MDNMIKFAAITEPKKTGIFTRPIPELTANDVLVKINSCNICTTDYGQWLGLRNHQPFPMAGGHENAGVIISKGDNVREELQVGDHVGFTFYKYCGECESCRCGNTGSCLNKSGWTKSDDGYYGMIGFATYRVINAKYLLKISKGIPFEQASFLEPLATAIQGLKKVGIKPLDNVVVIGAGTMGLVNAQAARVYGARVIVTELMEKKLDCARKLGFNVIDSSKQDPVQAVKDLTDGKGADVEILAVGASSANQQALEMAKKIGAKILFFAAGYPAPELKIGSNEIHYRKIELIGTFCANIADFQDSARMISNKCVNMGPLIEGHFRLDEIQKAYELASTPGSYRVAVHMWDE